MPKTIEMYACGICSSRYDTFEQALECESGGLPVENAEIQPGDEITYENEDGGGMFCYTQMTSVVIGKWVAKIGNQHQWVFGVERHIRTDKPNPNTLYMEQGVTACEHNYQGRVLMSPCELKFNPGVVKELTEMAEVGYYKEHDYSRYEKETVNG